MYAPFALHLTTDFEESPVEAIACHFSQNAMGVLELTVVEDCRATNHWVVGRRFEIGAVGLEADPSLGDGDDVPMTADGTEFYATYLSFARHVIQIVADGNCGLDVCCMMLHQLRGRLQRNKLREELSAFALQHAGNRALVASLSGLGEVKKHLGLYELENSGVRHCLN